MSNTRKAQPGSGFHQERFASSPEFDRGLTLKANLVALRCGKLKRSDDRTLIWAIQLASLSEEGLSKLASDLLAAYPERNATPSMVRIGKVPGQRYSKEEVRVVRQEIPIAGDAFLLSGELSAREASTLQNIPSPLDESEFGYLGLREKIEASNKAVMSKAAKRPSSHPVKYFRDLCREWATALPEFLAQLCLDPALKMDASAPWYFPRLIESLRELQAAKIEERRAKLVSTTLTEQVFETLDYSLETGRMTMIEGLPGRGKTYAAKAWCELHPGQARYVQVPGHSDEIGFYREIARALGITENHNSKVQGLRERIEDVLRDGHLMIVFDEAHWLLPSSGYRYATPVRINWLMTALTNKGTPVGLVTTPQFMRTQKAIEKRTSWTSEQFAGRIGHFQRLPDVLSEDELAAIANGLLQDGDAKSVNTLVHYTQQSVNYLRAMENAIFKARRVAQKDGRAQPNRFDFGQVIKGALSADDAFAGVTSRGRVTPPALPANPCQTEQGSATTSQRHVKPVELSPC